ncbi:MAG: hypothetical protein AABY53_10065 [Bdellovibrionota bacterium]
MAGFLVRQLRHLSYAFILIIVFVLTGLPIYAQTSTNVADKATSQAKSVKKQVISFEDELIEGSVDKPDLFYLFQKKNFNYKRLIRLRENFFPEMRRSTEDIKRLRGGN